MVTRKAFDALGHVVRTDVGGLVTTADYDGLGRVCRQINPDGSGVTYTYDCFGRQIASVESSGAVVRSAETITYDAAGREASASISTSGAASASNSVHTVDGLTTTTRVSGCRDSSLTIVVDGAGVLQSLAARFAGVALDLSVAATDSAGRVTSTSSKALPVVRTRSWAQAGQLARTVLGSAIADYRYSAVSGRKIHEAMHFAFGNRDESSDYVYDLTGRLAAATVNGVATTYGYDPQSGALIGIKRGQMATTPLSYEASGTGRLAAAGVRLYRSDSGGRRLAVGTAANPNETKFGWCGERLATITCPSGTAAYSYDASNRRIRSLVATAGQSTTTDFDYDGDMLMGLSAKRSDGATWTIDYAYDDAGRVFAGVYASSASGATPFLIETTDRGDVRELMDADGNSFAMYCYDAYGTGTETSSTGTARVPAALAAQAALRQPLRYASYVFDAESGLYYCSARYYDPTVAAFISKDPARADGDESAYQYCGGDPIGRTDPSGTMFLSMSSRDKFNRVRRNLVAAANQLVKWKIRYSHGAHVQQPKPHGQMDCSGAVAWILRRGGTWFSKRIPNPTTGSRWNTDSFVEHLTWKTKHWSRKYFSPGRDWQIGDVLVRGWSGGHMGHIVMVVQDGRNPKLFECAGSAHGTYHEGARLIPIATRLSSWSPVWAGRLFDYEPRAPYGGRI